MGKIDELIKQFCPNGVEVVELGKIAKLVRGKVISKKYVLDNNGEYPVYSSQTSNNGEFGRINTYMFDGDYVTWTTDGAYAGTVFRRTGKFNITNICGLIKLEVSSISVGFLYYWLAITAKKYVNRATDNPKLMSNVVATIKVPLPPLAVQKEIVEILDTFTRMIDNLQKELEQRQKQFEHYRDQMLTFKKGEVQMKPIKEIGKLVRGNGLQKKDFTEDGTGCIHYGQIYTRFGLSTSSTLTFVDSQLAAKLTKVSPGDLVIACTSENIEDVCKSVAWLGKEDIVTGGHACVFKHSENPKYIAYCFTTSAFFLQKRKYAYGAKVIDIKTEKLGEITLPIPSLETQQEIVDKLDTFEALISNIKQEIELRQKQYEYYREKLLTFE